MPHPRPKNGTKGKLGALRKRPWPRWAVQLRLQLLELCLARGTSRRVGCNPLMEKFGVIRIHELEPAFNRWVKGSGPVRANALVWLIGGWEGRAGCGKGGLGGAQAFYCWAIGKSMRGLAKLDLGPGRPRLG